MNPILKSKRTILTYCIAMMAIAVLYSTTFSTGTGVGSTAVILDIAVFWLIYGIEGIIIWNIFYYAIPQKRGKTRILLIYATGIIAVAITIGFEAIVAYNTSEATFPMFATTIPARAFTLMLAYIILAMWYLTDIESTVADETRPTTATIVKDNDKTETIDSITIRSGQKIKIIDPVDIEYIKAEGDYVALVTAEGRWLKEWTMKYLEENLPYDSFVRIHRSYIVGTKKIIRIEHYGKLYQVVLTCGEKIRVSPTGYKQLKERMHL